MYKKVFIVLSLLFLVSALAGAWYFRDQIRGIWVAFGTPSAEIEQLIKDDNSPLATPDGVFITIFASGFDRPRVLTVDPNGTLIASLTGEGRVVALPDDDQNGQTDTTITLTDKLNQPHGLALTCQETGCYLYIAETDKITRWQYDPQNLTLTAPQRIVDLPGGGQHGTRTLLFDPNDNNRLLVSIGSTCNVCYESNPARGTIQVIDLGEEPYTLQSFATGLRNAVFMTTHPVTKDVWVTEMGRDFLRDDLPPDEINIVKEGGKYGWPQCYGDNVHDTDFDKDLYRLPQGMTVCEALGFEPSYIDIPAHSAPLGLAFVPATEDWPQDWHHDLLVALHGSWNSTVPVGYKVVKYDLDENGQYHGVSDFITGWLPASEDNTLGRPADVVFDPDGNLYLSDDKSGVIYHITYVS